MNGSHHRLALPQGTRIQDFEFHRVLGQGGFGITYLGWNIALDIPVAIKEYLPTDLATRRSDITVVPQSSQAASDFEWGLKRFVDEARTLARFNHPNIIRVHHFFEAHGTAYIVMEYAEGETLSEYLNRRGTLSEEELKGILYPLLEGLEVVHRADFLHRDIKPGNIIIRDEDNSPVLLDFGAARQAIGSKSRSVTSIITPGYAPIEQYSTRGDQGPWTDIYALGAVSYHALTGQVPEDAAERVVHDALVPVVEQCAGQVSGEFLSAIDSALQVHKADRPQSIADWRSAMETTSSVNIPSRETPLPPEEQDHKKEDASPDPPPRKPRGKLIATLACLIAVLIGGGYYYHYEYVPAQRLKAQEAAEAKVASDLSDRVSALLSGAEEDLSRDRLTSPAGANAWEKYQEVLKLEPGHKIASAGLDSIIGRYVLKFDASLRRKEFSDAEGYMSRIQSVHADAPVLSDLEDRFRQAKIAEYEDKFEVAFLSIKAFDRASGYVDSLREINADRSLLSDLESRLSRVQEAEQARLDAQQVGRRFRDCVDCPEMVVVPPGSFVMGSPSGEEGRSGAEGPQHRVSINYRFAVGVYEVTFAEWGSCVGDGGCGGYRPDVMENWGRGNRPVIAVSWKDAQSYVRWLSGKTGEAYRLLSESEWEYVARAGTITPFHFGSTISTDRANYDGEYARSLPKRGWLLRPPESTDRAYAYGEDYAYDSGSKGVDRGETVPVGSFSSNSFGLYDVHGNVWEWTQDCWNGSYAGTPSDGSSWVSGDCSRRVLRGGSFDNYPGVLRSAARGWYTSELRHYVIGFRVARRF